MRDFSNRYIYVFSAIMVLIVAAVLSFTSLTLKPFQQKNVEIEMKRNILSSLGISSTPASAEAEYTKYIKEAVAVDASGEMISGVAASDLVLKTELAKSEESRRLPLYKAEKDGKFYTIFPVAGQGLWGAIWGYVALESDMNTIAGVTFAHASETPGLGAEIASLPFQAPFIGKQIFDESGSFVSISVMKPGSYTPDNHTVDAISGGTITSKALQNMLLNSLGAYKNYIAKNKIQ